MVLRSERGLLGLLAFIYIFSVDAAPIRNLEQQVLSVPGKEAKAADVANGKLGKGGKHKFRNRKMSKDPTGRFHARLRQQVSGVDVFEGDVVAHFDVGGSDVEDMTDATRPVGEVNMIPTLSEADCKAIALDASRKLAVVPSWGQSHEPNEPGNEIFTNQTAELNLYAPDEQHTFLTYKILTHLETLFSQNVHEVKEVTCLVDAHTGDVRKIWDSLGSIRDMIGGTMNTRFSGQRSATVNRVGTSFELRDTSRNVYVSNLGGATSGYPAVYSLGTTLFGDGGFATATALADVYYGMQLTLEYYQVRHGRNGWNNAGGQTFGRAHYGVNYQNAFWTSSCNCFSTGDGLEAVDVIAHEMTHGVIDSEGGLTYSGESGGLNEAYADIFATMVEYYGALTKGSPDAGDYLIGERLTVFGGALRNMANPIPPSVGSWYSGVGNLDVHHSSGIPNRAFYLLAEGGGVCNGIGRRKAADIFYHSLVAYFTSGTTFAQARNYHLQSAQTLYGSTTSPEYVAVACAWAAVNVR